MRCVITRDQGDLRSSLMFFCDMCAGSCRSARVDHQVFSICMVTRWRTWHRRWAALAAILGFALVSIYVTVMVSEGNNGVAELAPWVLAMLVPAFLSLSAWSIDADRSARVLLLGAAIIFLAIGVLSIFSLGIGFLLAGFVALFAANELPRATR